MQESPTVFQITATEKAMLRELSARLQRTQSDFVRALVKGTLEEMKKQNPAAVHSKDAGAKGGN